MERVVGERKRVFGLGSESSRSCWDCLKGEVVVEVYGTTTWKV
jgi:hypothetical protein